MLTALLFNALLDAWASVYADLSLGAAVETNINHAVISSEQQAAGSADLALALGVDKQHGRVTYWLEAGYGFAYVPAFSDFTNHAGSLALGARLRLEHGLSVQLQPFLSAQVYGDSARDNLAAGGALALRWRAPRWLHAALRFNMSHRSARDDVFDATSLRGSAVLGVVPVRWLDVTVGYSLAASDVIQYTYTPVTTASRGRGRNVTTFGEMQVATRERALIHSLHANAIGLLPLGMYLLTGYTGSRVELASQYFVDHIVEVRLGVAL